MDKKIIDNDKNVRVSVQGDIIVHSAFGMTSPMQELCGLRIVSGFGGNRAAGFDCRQMPMRRFDFYSISHLFEGSGSFWSQTSPECELTPGMVVLVTPGMLNRYGPRTGSEYNEDYICFSGPVADNWLKAGLIVPGVGYLGLSRRLLPIIELSRDPSPGAQANANWMLQSILMELYNASRHSDSDYELDRIVEDIRQHPDAWWTVESLAAKCGLSVAQFRRNFHRRTGLLPKEYIESIKLQQAADMLLSGRESVVAISGKLGYRDPYHFGRRFKQHFGIAPGRYRQNATALRHFHGTSKEE